MALTQVAVKEGSLAGIACWAGDLRRAVSKIRLISSNYTPR